MFLALRDLRFARGRFLLMGAVVALIAVLAVIITGLTSGLTSDGISGLRVMPVTHLAFGEGVTGDLFSRSTVPVSAERDLAARRGVRHAAAYGNQLAHATVRGKDLDLAVFGVEPGSFIAPKRLRPDGVLISKKFTDQGVRPGDTLIVEHSGLRLPVTGTVGDDSFGHVGVVYAPLPLWQRIRYGLPGRPPPEAFQEATAIALDESGASTAGFHVVTKSAAYAASPGFVAETGTMQLIKVFLYVISMFVVGAFFVVWTVQRRDEIAVVRALGGSRGYVLRDALAQVLIVLLAATAVGVVAGIGIAKAVAVSAKTAPIALEAGPIGTAAVLLVVLGLAGTVVAVRRVTSVDPLLALGGNR